MVRATVFYPRVSGARFDFDYYLGTHVPLARKLLGDAGLVRLEVDRGLSGEEKESFPRCVCTVHLYFHSASAFYAAMATHGEALGTDVPRFTNLELEIEVSEMLVA